VKRVNQLTNLVLVFMPDVGSKNYIYFSNMQRTCQQITQCYRSTILELQHHIAVRMACARHKLHYYPYRLLKKTKQKQIIWRQSIMSFKDEIQHVLCGVHKECNEFFFIIK
jgi:hypothetical protein